MPSTRAFGNGFAVAQESLFRQEVLKARQGSWLGDIAIASPLSRWALLALAATLGAAIVLFLVLGHYTRRESVVGQLVPSAGLLGVTAPGAGTVTRVLVRDGDRVKAGDVLLEISSNQDSSLLGDSHLRHTRFKAAHGSTTMNPIDRDTLGYGMAFAGLGLLLVALVFVHSGLLRYVLIIAVILTSIAALVTLLQGRG